ncbi:hypothetical protein [Hahella sp. HN01]|uniref:hypothetical protein n=1 Tax=Hahella sp. HN01 TaxID=2847262 RepID=UPI001C1EDA51|nr:hypothetical protein [Hahella sp. HN01]MBU6952518.1 hypothetical protein [Hahella sp. HN01]
MERPSTFYFPICWIGCTGYLVIKGDHDIVTFGSYVGMQEHIWVFIQGITLAAQGKNRRNTLTITEVSDPINTNKTLKRFLDGRYVTQEVEPKYSQPPIVLQDVDLYFAIRDLIWAQRYNWFQFIIK